MTNPLDTGAALPFSRGLRPGETRHLKAKDGSVIAAVTRTGQSYAQDLCDAYNAARTRDDVEWFVDANDQVRLRDREGWTRAHGKQVDEARERERQQWIHRHRYPVTAREDAA